MIALPQNRIQFFKLWSPSFGYQCRLSISKKQAKTLPRFFAKKFQITTQFVTRISVRCSTFAALCRDPAARCGNIHLPQSLYWARIKQRSCRTVPHRWVAKCGVVCGEFLDESIRASEEGRTKTNGVAMRGERDSVRAPEWRSVKQGLEEAAQRREHEQPERRILAEK